MDGFPWMTRVAMQAGEGELRVDERMRRDGRGRGKGGDHSGHISKKTRSTFRCLLIEFSLAPGLYLWTWRPGDMGSGMDGVIGAHHNEPLHCAESSIRTTGVTKRYFRLAVGIRAAQPFCRGFAPSSPNGQARRSTSESPRPSSPRQRPGHQRHVWGELGGMPPWTFDPHT